MINNASLLVIDMLNDFTREDGAAYSPAAEALLPNINILLQRCRERNILIIFVQHFYRKGKIDRNVDTMRNCCIEGTGGEEINKALYFDPVHDYLIRKRRYSAFFGTDLDLVLREHNTENVIIVGTKTNVCVRATATDAHNLNYKPIIVEDCTASDSEQAHLANIDDLRKYFGTVISLNNLLNQLREEG